MGGLPNSGRPQPESGRSSPDTLASFNTVTSASILRAHLAAGDIDEEGADSSNTSPGSDVVAKLKEAEEKLGAMRSEMQTHTDQLIEQIHDEHKQEVADLENEVEVL